MVETVSLYTVMFGLIAGLVVLALIIRLGTGRHASLMWVAAGLALGAFNNWLYAYWDAGSLTRAILYGSGPITIICVTQAIRLAFGAGHTRKRTLAFIALLILVSWSLLLLKAPIRLEAVPSLFGTAVAYADGIIPLWRRKSGFIRNGLIASYGIMATTALIRMPYFPALLEAGRAYPGLGPKWLTTYLLLVSSVAVPAVVLFLIAKLISGLIGAYRDRSERDALTDLLQRRAFSDTIRSQDISNGTIVVADIDHFKTVNDNYGHGIGDDVIRHFAKLLRTESALSARLGGEEFAVALPGKSLVEGREVAERLRERFSSYRHEGIDPETTLTASFGVAPYNKRMALAESLDRADRALYRAKRSGRNCVALFGTDQMEREEGGLAFG